MATRHTPAAGPTVEDLPLKAIDAGDDTFRQRAIMDVASLVAELRVGPQRVPIFVRRRADRRYQIIAGFRRVHALKELGRPTAKAIVVTGDDHEAWQIAWAENAAHLKPRSVDLIYLVFKLHHEGKNDAEIAQLCGMNARDRARVAAVGSLPEPLRQTLVRLGLSLRYAALVATFTARHPGHDVTPVLEAAAAQGLNEAHFAAELKKLAKPRGRKVVGVRFPSKGHVAINTARAQPETWNSTTRKRVRELVEWLEAALAQAEPAPRGRPPKPRKNAG